MKFLGQGEKRIYFRPATIDGSSPVVSYRVNEGAKLFDAPAAVFDVETQRLQMDYEDVMYDRNLRYLEAVENDRRYSVRANRARTSNVYRGKVLGYGLREVYLRSWHDDSIDVIPIPDNASSEFFDFFRVGDIAEFITNDKKEVVHKYQHYKEPEQDTPAVPSIQQESPSLHRNKGRGDDDYLGL